MSKYLQNLKTKREALVVPTRLYTDWLEMSEEDKAAYPGYLRDIIGWGRIREHLEYVNTRDKLDKQIKEYETAGRIGKFSIVYPTLFGFTFFIVLYVGTMFLVWELLKHFVPAAVHH